MFIVEFSNCFGDRRMIGSAAQRDEAFKIISSFLNDHNYKCYYMRSWESAKNETCVDVGSHSECFYIIETDTNSEGKDNNNE